MKKLKFTRGDFFGGLTAGIVALPLALAFGVQSGIGAEAGLYGAIFLGFFASLLGGTESQISGPTGPMTVVSSATIGGFIAVTGGVEAAMGAIVACFILSGLIQVLMGVLKIGSLIKYIPYPVISGFMSGIGVIIIILQIFPALGNQSPKSIIAVVTSLGEAFGNINSWAFIYTALTIAIIYLFPKITKAVPSTLIALLSVTILSVILQKDVPIIGNIPQGFPALQLGGLLTIDSSMYVNILTAAITLAALGSIDSLLTSVVADNVTKTKHSSNRELVGQGIGNSISALFAGLPGAGATMRTLVNIRSGGRNRISGLIHAVTLLAILLGLGAYAELIPNSVLAGILITVGIGILDYKGFRHIAKVPKPDAAIMILVLLVTVFLDLLTAVGIGMVLGAILFMKKMSDITAEKTKVTDVTPYEKELHWNGNGTAIPQIIKDNVLVKQIEGPLFFGFAQNFQERVSKLHSIKYVIIRMEKVPFMDQTGLYALEESILALEQKGIDVLFTGLQEQPEGMLRRIKLIPDLISEEHLFKDLHDCITWVASEKSMAE